MSVNHETILRNKLSISALVFDRLTTKDITLMALIFPQSRDISGLTIKTASSRFMPKRPKPDCKFKTRLLGEQYEKKEIKSRRAVYIFYVTAMTKMTKFSGVWRGNVGQRRWYNQIMIDRGMRKWTYLRINWSYIGKCILFLERNSNIVVQRRKNEAKASHLTNTNAWNNTAVMSPQCNIPPTPNSKSSITPSPSPIAFREMT